MRRVMLVVAAGAVLVASACTYTIADPGTTVVCGPIEVELNPHGSSMSTARRQAVVDAVVEFGVLVGRPVVYRGETTAVAANHRPGDPLLIELLWPDGAPSAWGYAEPATSGGHYVEGWIYVNPVLAAAPAGVIRRLVLHELGHIYGLDDVTAADELMNPALPVDAFGAGDLTGFIVTHDGGCPGNVLVPTLADTLG